MKYSKLGTSDVELGHAEWQMLIAYTTTVLI